MDTISVSSQQRGSPPPQSSVEANTNSSPTDAPSKSPTSSPSGPTSPTLEEGLSIHHLTNAIAVLLGLLLLRTGFFNIILVLAISVTLLLNPYVRTFLDIPSLHFRDGSDHAADSSSPGGTGARFGTWDPARYFTAFSLRSSKEGSEVNKDRDVSEGDEHSRDTSRSPSDQQTSLSPLPPHLKNAVDQLAPLVIRDFVQGWYDHHSFGYPSFPRSVRGTLDYFTSSIWTRTLTTNLHSVDVATELLLTGSSVFLTCIRRKRIANVAAQAGDRLAASAVRRGGTGHWNSNEERIASLRAAMRSFFERHLPPNERESDLVFALLTEVLTKQLWNLILTVGEPDFLNRTLVDWKQGQLAVGGGSPTSSTAEHHAASSGDHTLRPASALSDRQAAAATLSRPTSTAMGDRSPSSPNSRPPSTVPERSLSAAGGAIPPSPLLPDRPTISSPPSRADSPMMPRFTTAPLTGPQTGSLPPLKMGQPQGFLSTDQSHGRPPSVAGQHAMRHSMQARSSVPETTQRRSSEAHDGLSTVMDGLGSVLKGAGKGVDALVGGMADTLAGDKTDHNSNGPSHLSSLSENANSSAAWRRDPASVDRTPMHPEILQDHHNIVRRKQPKHRKDDITDLMASQAAWPSNVPADLHENLPDGDNLPESLKASLRQEALSSIPSTSVPGPASRTISPGPPRMTPSLPYEISSPRSSSDHHSRAVTSGTTRPGSAAGPTMSPVISLQPQPVSLQPPRPPSSSSNNPPSMMPPSLPPRITGPSSSASPLPPVPSLSSVLSRQDSQGLYDSFEAFLENPPPGQSHLTIRGEGEELLRLQIGLGTIERLVPRGSGHEAEMFREDASTILSKARECLKGAIRANPSPHGGSSAEGLVRTLDKAIARLGFGAKGFDGKEGTVRDALDPVHVNLTMRLKELYDAFWQTRSEKLKESKSTRSNVVPTQPPSMTSSLAYEPRKKVVATPPPPQPPSHGVGHPVQPLGLDTPTRNTTMPLMMTTAPTPPARPNANDRNMTILQAPKPRQPIIEQLIDLDEEDNEGDDGATDSLLGNNNGGPSFQVSITDISSNAERPNAPVDLRSFEFICAVDADGGSSGSGNGGGGAGGGGGGSGGFVLVRRWAEIVTLDKELRRFSSGLRDLPPLPAAKGKTSSALCVELEGYLAALLSNPRLACLPPVEKFADRSRAAAAGRGGFNPFSSGVELGKNLGKGFVEGVGAVGKAAASGLQNQSGSFATPPKARRRSVSVDLATEGDTEGEQYTPERTLPSLPPRAPQPPMTAQDDDATPTVASTGSTVGGSRSSSSGLSSSSTTTSAVASKSSQGLSPRALDALLTSIFALADEALSLTGAWSMRRGVVRLLQSVVRQSYSAAIVSAFDGTASALSSHSIARALLQARHTFWSSPSPSGSGSGSGEAGGQEASRWWYEKGPARSAKERFESEEKARQIVLGYAPTQAAFVLGPGGRNACERALESVHAVVCEDEGALDLVLTLTLRTLQML